MNKIKKIIIGALVVVAVGVGVILAIGPSDPIVLSEDEIKELREAETKQFADIDLDGFKARTLDDEVITSWIFKDFDVTMVNIWETGCSPCVEEMPYIEELYKSLPEKSNIISICVDIVNDDKNLKLARKIIEKSGVSFKTLIPDEVIRERLTDEVQAFPTTIFIDKEGKTIGTPHFGAQDEEAYRESILERLRLVEEK